MPRFPRPRRLVVPPRARSVVAVAVVAGSALVLAAAPAGAAVPAGKIVVDATGTVEATPDSMTVNIGVRSRAETAAAALDRANTLVAQVVQVLKGAGVRDRDLKTTELSIGPEYQSDPNKPVAYVATNVVRATVRDLSKAGAVADAAARAAGDDVILQGVSFDVQHPTGAQRRARVAAVKAARDQAQRLARAAGMKLGDVVSIRETATSGGPIVTERLAAASDAIPVEPGTQQVSVTIHVVFTTG